VLKSLINSIVDARVLQPINTLWLRVVGVSACWVGLLIAATYAFQSMQHLQIFLELAATQATSYRIGMLAFGSILLAAQAFVVKKFLNWRAKRIAHELVGSIERLLLGLLSDAEVLALLRFTIDNAVTLLIEELTGSAAGGWLESAMATTLSNVYGEWGGTAKVMTIVDEQARESVRPAIVESFNVPLKRSEEEAAALTRAVQAPAFEKSMLDDGVGAMADERLERLLVTLNDAINKSAVEKAALTVQQGFRVSRDVKAAGIKAAGATAGAATSVASAVTAKSKTVHGTRVTPPEATPASSAAVQSV